MKVLSFDSNIVIDLLIGVQEAADEIRVADQPWISRVTWIEVLSKIDEGSSIGATERVLSRFAIDELSEPISHRAPALRRGGRKLKLADAVILASAQINGRTLVTRNTKDFPPGSPGVHVPYTL